MISSSSRKNARPASPEINSEKILMQKMGISKKEIREVTALYGVNPSRLIELMMLSKYQFVYNGKAEGQCEPCHHLRRINVSGT